MVTTYTAAGLTKTLFENGHFGTEMPRGLWQHNPGGTSLDDGQMKVVPLLWQMRAAVSSDGRIAKFFLTFKGGQHSAFAVPFHKAGLFLKAIRSTIAMMSDRLAAQKPDAPRRSQRVSGTRSA